jgi:hypothetical protein
MAITRTTTTAVARFKPIVLSANYRALTAIGSSSTFQPVNLLDPGRPAAVDRCLERA